MIGLAVLIVGFGFRRWDIIEGVYVRFRDWILYGVIIDLVLAAYLPVCINLLVGVASMNWIDADNGEMFSNIMTILLTLFYFFVPFAIFIHIYVNRHKIGQLKTVTLSYVNADVKQMQIEREKQEKEKLDRALWNEERKPKRKSTLD